MVATQAILYSLRARAIIRSRAALGAGEQRFTLRFDYMGKSKWFFSLSGCILLIGALAIARQGDQLRHRLRRRHAHHRGAAKPASVDQIRNVLDPHGLADAKIQTISNPELGTNVVQISTKQLGPQRRSTGAERALDQAFGVRGQPNAGVDRPELRPERGQLGA